MSIGVRNSLMVLLLGGLIGWVVVKRETEFLDAFCQELHSVTREGTDPQLLVGAPSKELDALRRAFLSMGVRWRQREDDERAQRQKLEHLVLKLSDAKHAAALYGGRTGQNRRL